MLELMQIRFNYLCRAGRENKEGKNPIVLRISYRNERRDLYTGLYCGSDDWDNNVSKVIKGKLATTVNQNLDLIYRKAHHCFDQLKFSGHAFSLDDLVNKIKGKEERPSLLLEYLKQRKDEIKERVGVDITLTTQEKYERSLQYMTDFIENSAIARKHLLINVNKGLLEKYFHFLRKDKEIGNNTATYMQTDANVSASIAVLQPSVTKKEDYTLANRNWLEVTTLVGQNKTTPLGISQKIGLQLNIPGDNGYPGSTLEHYRCFHTGYMGKINGAPALTYYYYVCGDVANTPMYPGDPYDNQLITCYTRDTATSFCLSKFTQRKSVNPYVEGVWGNWRVDTSFVYYGTRAESTVIDNTPVDLRTGGTITGFKKFWNFAGLPTQYLSRNYSASDVWVWNSSITQYNRKGYEVENKDPLGRFNAGLYGYNQQLPVAVINNSRYSESMFDGFEDYDYQSNGCAEFCKPRKHTNMVNVSAFLDASQKHSGKQSLKLNAGQTFEFTAPVLAAATLDRSYRMRVRIDSSSHNITKVTSDGNGLTAKYLKFSSGNNNNAMMSAANSALTGMAGNGATVTRIDPVVNLGGVYQPPVNIGWGKFVGRWEGHIQAINAGSYTFRVSSNDAVRVWIGGTMVINKWSPGWQYGEVTLTRTQGQVATIKVEYVDTHAGGGLHLEWKKPGMGFETIPQQVLFSLDNYASSQNNVTATTVWCTPLDSVNVRNNALTDTF